MSEKSEPVALYPEGAHCHVRTGRECSINCHGDNCPLGEAPSPKHDDAEVWAADFFASEESDES